MQPVAQRDLAGLFGKKLDVAQNALLKLAAARELGAQLIGGEKEGFATRLHDRICVGIFAARERGQRASGAFAPDQTDFDFGAVIRSQHARQNAAINKINAVNHFARMMKSVAQIQLQRAQLRSDARVFGPGQSRQNRVGGRRTG